MSTPATTMTAAGKTAAGKATTRAAGAQRALVGLIGLLSLAAGASALVVGQLGVTSSVLDPVALDAVRTHQTLARGVAIAAGVVLLLLGLLWAVRAVKPERRPNLLLDPSPNSWLEVSASAVADALRADTETVAGVNRARARMVGTTASPVVRLDLWLEDGADVRDVYHSLDSQVLARARDSLGVESLPTAIRIELDAAAPPRVS